MSVMTYDITIGVAWTVLGGALAALAVLLVRFAYAVGETASKSRRRRDTTPYLTPVIVNERARWPRRYPSAGDCHGGDLSPDELGSGVARILARAAGEEKTTEMRRWVP